VRPSVPIASVLPGARVGRRGPGRVCGVIGVQRGGVRHGVGRADARWAHAAAIPPRARPFAFPPTVPVAIPLTLAIAITVPVPVPLPVAVSVSVPVAISIFSFAVRPAPFSVQIIALQAAIPILAILVFVFMSAVMEEAKWW
jgi:hypothetical protein